MTDAELLAWALQASGLSARKFAAEVLIRDERQVRRWLAGKPLPPTVRGFLEHRLEERTSGLGDLRAPPPWPGVWMPLDDD